MRSIVCDYRAGSHAPAVALHQHRPSPTSSGTTAPRLQFFSTRHPPHRSSRISDARAELKDIAEHDTAGTHPQRSVGWTPAAGGHVGLCAGGDLHADVAMPLAEETGRAPEPYGKAALLDYENSWAGPVAPAIGASAVNSVPSGRTATPAPLPAGRSRRPPTSCAIGTTGATSATIGGMTAGRGPS